MSESEIEYMRLQIANNNLYLVMLNLLLEIVETESSGDNNG